jgi:hypothetical protein
MAETESSDEVLVERLREIARAADPVPAHVDELARAALATRTLDELARLLSDSDEGAAVLTRGEAGTTRLLSFATDDVAIEVQLETLGDGTVAVRGLVRGPAVPAPTGVLVVVRGGPTRTVDTDEGGFFSLPGMPVALVRLRAAGATTEWFQL